MKKSQIGEPSLKKTKKTGTMSLVGERGKNTQKYPNCNLGLLKTWGGSQFFNNVLNALRRHLHRHIEPFYCSNPYQYNNSIASLTIAKRNNLALLWPIIG